MKVIIQYIDSTPTRINRAFQAAYGEETIAFLWYDMDSLMNSVRECLWKITNDLDPNLEENKSAFLSKCFSINPIYWRSVEWGLDFFSLGHSMTNF